MTIKEIFTNTHHRPWRIPDEKWKFYQEWNKVVFLHWQVDYDELKKFVPDELEIDLFDGKPWISLVAFTMEEVRPKKLPAFKPISNFDEINIRTYIKSNNKTGVYFLSIEAGKVVSCLLAKKMSGLPYRYSEMNRTDNQYHSKNLEFEDSFEIQYSIENELKNKTALCKWLTERYALFQDTGNSINEFEIHHPEWPVQEIKIDKLAVNYPRFKNLINGNPDKVHYSKGVQVVTWGKKKIMEIDSNKD